MSPENHNNESILPEEPYFEHYQDMDKPKEEVNKDNAEQKPETKKGFISMKKLLTIGGIALALPAGIYAHKQYENETRFPDNYHAVETQEPVAKALNVVDPEAASQLENEPIKSNQEVPWVSASNYVIPPVNESNEQ